MRKHNKYIADVTKQAAHHEALVRGDGRAGDGPGVAHADVLARALVVVPELQQAVLAAGDVVGPVREGNGRTACRFFAPSATQSEFQKPATENSRPPTPDVF